MFHPVELVLALLAVAVGLGVVARRMGVAYPVLLVVGGLLLGLQPWAPSVALDPQVVFLLFLPPLLYAAAFFTSLRDLRAKLRPIAQLSIGLVLATVAGVAVVAHAAVSGLGWGPAFVLGAVVAPTDPVAATAIARRLGAPRRVITLVEGESLINDASALVLYRAAVVAVVSGSFSIWHVGLRFMVGAAGGFAIGLAIGWIVASVRKRIDYIPAEIAISLLTAYLAYLPAAALGVSGVLAAVTAGVYLGWRSPEISSPAMRMQGLPVWETLVFLANSLLFVLVGLELRPILDSLSGHPTGRLLLDAAVVSGVVIAIRLVWVFPLVYGPKRLFRWLRGDEHLPPWHLPALLGWMGMRGAVSLAAALAIPLRTDSGAPFPGRELIVFLAFGVIFVTLVVQGLTLPPLIRMLRIEDDGLEAREEAKARIKAADAAIARVDELAAEEWVREDTAERLRGLYRFRKDRFAARFDGEDDGSIEERSMNYQRLRRELLEAERRAVVDLRRAGVISDDVMHRIERDLDLEDTRLDV